MVELRGEGLNDRQIVERSRAQCSHRLNQATPVTATAAVCVAMLRRRPRPDPPQLLHVAAPARYLHDRNWPVAWGSRSHRASHGIADAARLGGLGCVDLLLRGASTVWGIGADQHLIVAVYRNSAIHVLVMRAIAELALLAIVRTPGATKRTGWERALAVRELLKFDFFFAGQG